jgi:hypothetical protein
VSLPNEAVDRKTKNEREYHNQKSRAIVAGNAVEKIWVSQCKATKSIKRRFGAKSALDYLIGEKLTTFAEEADRRPECERELPKFLAGIWQVFNEYEIAGYVAKPETDCAQEAAQTDVRSRAADTRSSDYRVPYR